jgi:hypothetical protein
MAEKMQATFAALQQRIVDIVQDLDEAATMADLLPGVPVKKQAQTLREMRDRLNDMT